MQLVLPVSQVSEKSFDNLVMGQNALLVHQLHQAVDALVDSKQTKIIFVHGNSGVGKTHLSLAISELCHQQNISARYLDMDMLVTLPVGVLDDVSVNQCICFDNIHSLSQSADWQRMVFDIINQCIEKAPRCLVFTSKHSVNQLDLSLPDLASRLTWGLTFKMLELSDADKAKAMQSLAREKGMEASEEVIEFILKRSNRSMHEIEKTIECLDRASLLHQRKLTIPFVKETLAL
ncbi:DnaA regulatory inactivator Hda [Agaribacter flavus]|uniref:DnaA regulatory inactivator Hda n=1 Tax=Agaribacter flavus TaxID=1902781 RepID=A0ABV7FNV4_9ALTE